MRRCDLHCRAARWDEVRRQCAQAYPLQTLEPDTAAPAERAGAAASDAEAPMRAAGMAELGKAVNWALAALGSLKLAGKASSAMAGAAALAVALDIKHGPFSSVVDPAGVVPCAATLVPVRGLYARTL